MFFVHVPARADALVTLPQFRNPLGSAPQVAEIPRHGVHEAEPLVQHVKDEYVPVVIRRRFAEREIVVRPCEREAVGPELLDIHLLQSQFQHLVVGLKAGGKAA